jgi:hypothetical protein
MINYNYLPGIRVACNRILRWVNLPSEEDYLFLGGLTGVRLATGHACISSLHSKCRVNSPGVGCGDSQNKCKVNHKGKGIAKIRAHMRQQPNAA